MPTISFGKRQRLAYISAHALAERIVPAFDMGGFPGLFPHAAMRFFWKDRGIRLPKIAVTDALPIGGGNPPPQPPTRAFAPVADDKGDDLARPAALRRP